MSVSNQQDTAALRALAHELLVEAQGDCSLWNVFEDIDSELGDIDLDKLATDAITIVSGFWGQSRTSGEDSYVAYSLGFECWYVVHTDSLDEVTFDGIVSDTDLEESFKNLARRWIEEVGPASCSLPTSFYSLYSHEPWFIRELTEAIGKSHGDPLDTIVHDILGREVVTDAAREAMHTYWWSAVEMAGGQGNAEVPGLAVASADQDIPEFNSWVEQVALTWRDTGNMLDVDDAGSLRLTCQFLALA